MSGEINCPFCMSRLGGLTRLDPSTLAEKGTREVFPCPCGAVGTLFPFEKAKLAERGPELVTELSTGSLDAPPHECDVLLTDVPDTEPTLHLLWVKRL
ncbi:MAG: hypothetical protein ACE5G5_00300 [Candidatus Methylomirabilales bacterium]